MLLSLSIIIFLSLSYIFFHPPSTEPHQQWTFISPQWGNISFLCFFTAGGLFSLFFWYVRLCFLLCYLCWWSIIYFFLSFRSLVAMAVSLSWTCNLYIFAVIREFITIVERKIKNLEFKIENFFRTLAQTSSRN